MRLLSREDANGDEVNLDIKQDGQKLTVLANYIRESKKHKQYLTDIEVPIVHNVNVNAVGDACIDIHDFMESNYINLNAEEGRVTLHKIKTESLAVQTESGDIVCHGQLHVIKKRRVNRVQS